MITDKLTGLEREAMLSVCCLIYAIAKTNRKVTGMVGGLYVQAHAMNKAVDDLIGVLESIDSTEMQDLLEISVNAWIEEAEKEVGRLDAEDSLAG